ncbi:TetR/AcrR family transcriptional regulator [Cognatishimia sp. SS12]|uniref:TetR/AcrR family transcriptional regulator n=1 Tax=Cognatishimia sp. SS12 TaxID=2979465 RepID=UPI00232D3F9C|nr:TetR/AcrR family transcriptional regulator [Cognatishimia sp. SS12]MDC0738819.1 TetR/AcrR family transcriptional regulator [Cognatishimia sp. SS12]
MTKTKHHHGNLKEALVTAGLALLEEGGIDALSLRKCAARAGVSHAAPAHHFDGLPGLKSAIAVEAFGIFSSYLQTAVDEGEQSAQARLKNLCRGYMQFGLDHGGLLAVIFGGAGLASYVPGAGKEEAHAYLILREVCAPFVGDHDDKRVIEAQVWSLIHGFTLLYVSGEFGPPHGQDGPFEAVMDLLNRIGNRPAP